MNRKLLCFLILILAAAQMNAQNAAPIILWENGAPNAVGSEPQDVPTITPFFPPKEKATGAAIIVCPGGGYSHLSDVKEGSAVAEWLNSLGITAVVLKYRLGMRYHQPNQLLDASRAVRTVRARAKEWNLDEKRIGILGFSAGGHLASTLSTQFDAGKADSPDSIERISSRPDVQILIYPVITMGEFTHAGSKKNLLGEKPPADLIKRYSGELNVKSNTPPAFLVHAMTDTAVPPENSLLYVAALRQAKVPFELHIYEQGPHGFGLASANPILSSWAERCADWLSLRGFAKARVMVETKK